MVYIHTLTKCNWQDKILLPHQFCLGNQPTEKQPLLFHKLIQQQKSFQLTKHISGNQHIWFHRQILPAAHFLTHTRPSIWVCQWSLWILNFLLAPAQHQHFLKLSNINIKKMNWQLISLKTLCKNIDSLTRSQFKRKFSLFSVFLCLIKQAAYSSHDPNTIL